MAKETAKLKVVKDKLNHRIKIRQLLGNERGRDILDGKVIEVNQAEYDIMIKNNWIKLEEQEENG